MNRNHGNAFCLNTGAILLLLLSLLTATAVQAEKQNGGWAGDWLTNYKSARAMGLGGSFVGLADEPLGMMWNPAGMTQPRLKNASDAWLEVIEMRPLNSNRLMAPLTTAKMKMALKAMVSAWSWLPR